MTCFGVQELSNLYHIAVATGQLKAADKICYKLTIQSYNLCTIYFVSM